MGLVYIDGKYTDASKAVISVFDRGLNFAESVYEVTAVIDGHMVDNDLHLERFQRTISTVGLELPLDVSEIAIIQRELIHRNSMKEGVVYLQITGGTAEERSFLLSERPRATLIGFCQTKTITTNPALSEGILVATMRDDRWANRSLKTTMLLPQVHAKAAAKARGCDEAWLVENGMITEGASSTPFIVSHGGRLITRRLSTTLLPGCTRQAILSTCDNLKMPLELRPFTPDEAIRAREAFITSATNPFVPVVTIDGQSVHDGRPGPITLRVQKEYLSLARAQFAKTA